MPKEPTAGAGTVEIQLIGDDGELHAEALVPSFNAAITLSKNHGGLTNVLQNLLRGDVQVLHDVVALGLGYDLTGHMKDRPPKGLGERIWKTGFTDSTGRMMEFAVLYVRVLMNGGRMPDDTEEVEGDDEDQADRPL